MNPEFLGGLIVLSIIMGVLVIVNQDALWRKLKNLWRRLKTRRTQVYDTPPIPRPRHVTRYKCGDAYVFTRNGHRPRPPHQRPRPPAPLPPPIPRRIVEIEDFDPTKRVIR